MVDRDHYLVELCCYIVLNPVRAGLVTQAGAWPWRSYRATVHEVGCPPWLHVAGLLDHFGTTPPVAFAAYAQFVTAGIAAALPWRQLRGQMWRGIDAFLRALEARMQQYPLAAVPGSQRHPAHPRPAEIIEAVGGAYQLRGCATDRTRVCCGL